MKLLIPYISILFILAVLPINGTHSALNNNYLLSIRWDYLLHALIYIPLFPLLTLGARSKERKVKPNIIQKEVSGANESKGIRAFGLAIFLGFILEAVQYIIPWRSFNLNDLMANLLGVGLGVILWLMLKN